jgi:hypothetical protein
MVTALRASADPADRRSRGRVSRPLLGAPGQFQRQDVRLGVLLLDVSPTASLRVELVLSRRDVVPLEKGRGLVYSMMSIATD